MLMCFFLHSLKCVCRTDEEINNLQSPDDLLRVRVIIKHKNNHASPENIHTFAFHAKLILLVGFEIQCKDIILIHKSMSASA